MENIKYLTLRIMITTKIVVKNTKKTKTIFGNKKNKRDLIAFSCSIYKSDFGDTISYKTLKDYILYKTFLGHTSCNELKTT